MELNSELIVSAPRDAATVVAIRDGALSLEVLLIKRHGLSDVLGGAYVFPGGKVDASDAQLDAALHLDDTASSLHLRLNETELAGDVAAGIFVAAAREVFEESGVLFAVDATTAQTQQAQALLKSGLSFVEVLARLQLRLQTKRLQPWTRWITPKMASVMSKRFDTRFFIAALPAGQVAAHDNHEATDSVWLSPRTALEQQRDGLIELAPPQIMSLVQLARHTSVQSALAEANSRLPPVIEPEPFELDGHRVICYPGDARHSIQQRAMPGPTRLRFRNKRFEALDGFDSFFA